MKTDVSTSTSFDVNNINSLRRRDDDGPNVQNVRSAVCFLQALLLDRFVGQLRRLLLISGLCPIRKQGCVKPGVGDGGSEKGLCV